MLRTLSSTSSASSSLTTAARLTKKIVGARSVLLITEGFYDLFYVTAEPACMAECDRVMKITDELLKHMIVRADED